MDRAMGTGIGPTLSMAQHSPGCARPRRRAARSTRTTTEQAGGRSMMAVSSDWVSSDGVSPAPEGGGPPWVPTDRAGGADRPEPDAEPDPDPDPGPDGAAMPSVRRAQKASAM